MEPRAIESIPRRYAIVGKGRLGCAMFAAMSTDFRVRGPYGRGADIGDANVVLLCVPDREIAAASAAILRGPIVGHMSASADLAVLEPHEERFVLHPLLSVAGPGTTFAGATCMIDGTETGHAIASNIAHVLGMRPRHVAQDSRALYHAAASAAANYVTTVLGMAETLGAAAGIERAGFAQLVRGAVDNWVVTGARESLTGPIARGDVITVSKQRAAVASAAPELLPLWDALADATLDLASTQRTP